MDRKRPSKNPLRKAHSKPQKRNTKITDIKTERQKREYNYSHNTQYEKYSRPYKSRNIQSINKEYTNYNNSHNNNKRPENTNRDDKYRNIEYRNRQNNHQRPDYTVYKKNKKIKGRKRYLNVSTNIFTAFLLCFMIVYFSVSIIKGISKKPIDYNVISYGTIDNHTKVDGVITRDEIVYKAPKTGILEFNIPENEKVKKGSNIVKIKDEQNITATEEDLENINKEILKLQEKRKDLSLFSEDIKKIDTQIQNALDNSIGDFLSYEMNKIYETKDSVENKINIKNQKLLSESTGGLKTLSEQKIKKEQELNKNIETIYTNHSGVVSFYTDGLEDTFTKESKNTITKEQTKMKQLPNPEFKMSVLKDEPIFKIVKDNTFFISSYIKTRDISNWKVGQEKTIYINDNGTLSPLDVFIESIDIKDKESFVILRCNKNMIDYIDKRNITFDINLPKEGFKIEKDAILKQKLLKIPKSYVTNEAITKKTIDGEKIININPYIKDSDGAYFYVSISEYGIDIGDTILNKDKKEYKLTQTSEMDGIYIVNSGAYSFMKIDTQNSTEDDQFIIIDPNRNRSIRLYDRYAPNASNVVKQGDTPTNDRK